MNHMQIQRLQSLGLIATAMLALALFVFVPPCAAQQYPAQAVTFVVPFAAKSDKEAADEFRREIESWSRMVRTIGASVD